MIRPSHPHACAAILAAALATAAAADIPTSFTYQGRLMDNGQPASGPHDLRFQLYDSAAGGSLVGSEVCFNDFDVPADGLFSVQLDFGDPFSGAPRWLQISVRVDAARSCSDKTGLVPLAPRQELTCAPHAAYARHAPWDGVLNKPASLPPNGPASGDLTGTYPAPSIAAGAVTPAKISSAGASIGQVLTCVASGVAWSTPAAAGLTLPFSAAVALPVTAFSISNGGGGKVMELINLVPLSVQPVLRLASSSAMADTALIELAVVGPSSDPAADALEVRTNSPTGHAGHFESVAATCGGSTLYAHSAGLGPAGEFVADPSENVSPALRSIHYGGGSAGFFHTPSDSNVPTLRARNDAGGYGQGIAALFEGWVRVMHNLRVEGDLSKRYGSVESSCIPVAFGSVIPGAALTATDNVLSAVWAGGTQPYCDIELEGELFTTGNYVAVITPIAVGATPRLATGSASSGSLRVRVYGIEPVSGAWIQYQNAFHFVVYRP